MRTVLVMVGFVVGAGVFGAGCGAATDPAAEATSEATTTVVTTEPTTEATAQPSTAPPAGPTADVTAEVSWPMPDLVGQDLQTAQNAIQRLTANAVFFTSSTDATGQGRAQVLDSNWRTCAQNVPAGQPISAGTKIEFAVVKLEENCP